MRKIFVFGIVLLSNFFTKGQDWQVMESERLRYYLAAEHQQIVYNLDSLFTAELRLVEKRINYYLNGKLDIFITSDKLLIERLNTPDSSYASHSGGSIVREINTLVLDVYQHPVELIQFFRQEISKKIISEMLYGGSLSDVLKYDQGGYLPNWLLDGLFLYLSNGWDSELDAKWRNVYEKNAGFSVKNNPNNEIQKIKGAAFWHFIEQEYGTSAISALLYFSRLNRKFSKSIKYVLKSSPAEINIKWSNFYTLAYQRDFSKRIPINGMLISKSSVVDYQLYNESEILLLKNTFWGNRLHVVNSDNGRIIKKYKLPRGFKTLKNVESSIQVLDKIHVVMEKQGEYYDIAIDGNISKLPVKRITSIAKANEGMLILESNFLYSNVYFKSFKNESFDSLFQINGYVTFLDSSIKNGKIFTVATPQENFLIHQKNNTIDTLIRSIHPINTPFFFSDEKIILNFDNNGIINGCILDLNTKILGYLTDYRTNILSHRFKNGFLIEKLTIGNRTYLFKTNYLGDSTLEKFTNISPTFFFENRVVPFKLLVAEPDEIKMDSIVPYEFIPPVPQNYDYTYIANDSLNLKKNNRIELKPLVPKLFTNSFFLQINNHLLENQQIAFSNAYPTYLPRRLNIYTGSVISDQFKKKHTFLGFNGLTSVGNYDILLKQQQLLPKGNMIVYYSFLYRNRKLIDIDLERIFNYLTIIPNLGMQWTVTKESSIDLNLYYRFDNQTNNFSTQESFDIIPVTQNIVGLNILHSSKVRNDLGRLFLSKITINPYYLESVNLSTKIDLTFRQILNNFTQVRVTSSKGLALGQQPIVYMLGGVGRDILGNQFTGQFNNQSNPALYDFVYQLRGFAFNHRGGDKYFCYNIDLDISPFETWAGRTYWDQFINSINFHIFTDGGIAFWGNTMYHGSNPYSFTTVINRNDIAVRVLNYQNPFLLSAGVGTSFKIFSYNLKFEIARGLEFKVLNTPAFHISLGHRI